MGSVLPVYHQVEIIPGPNADAHVSCKDSYRRAGLQPAVSGAEAGLYNGSAKIPQI